MYICMFNMNRYWQKQRTKFQNIVRFIETQFYYYLCIKNISEWILRIQIFKKKKHFWKKPKKKQNKRKGNWHLKEEEIERIFKGFVFCEQIFNGQRLANKTVWPLDNIEWNDAHSANQRDPMHTNNILNCFCDMKNWMMIMNQNKKRLF